MTWTLSVIFCTVKYRKTKLFINEAGIYFDLLPFSKVSFSLEMLWETVFIRPNVKINSVHRLHCNYSIFFKDQFLRFDLQSEFSRYDFCFQIWTEQLGRRTEDKGPYRYMWTEGQVWSRKLHNARRGQTIYGLIYEQRQFGFSHSCLTSLGPRLGCDLPNLYTLKLPSSHPTYIFNWIQTVMFTDDVIIFESFCMTMCYSLK